MKLNLETITHSAWKLIHSTDVCLVGTSDYIGVAYFWAHKYRHSLRDASCAVRCRVHSSMLAEGLGVAGETPAHDAIVNRWAN